MGKSSLIVGKGEDVEERRCVMESGTEQCEMKRAQRDNRGARIRLWRRNG